jgi:AraC-like DNA-binding protein
MLRTGDTMDVGAAPPLQWRHIFGSRDVEATRAYLHARFGTDLRFTPARRQERRIDLRVGGIDLPSIFIHHVRFATGIAIEGSRPDGHYVILLPTSGCIEASAGGSSIVSDPHRAVIFSRPITPASMLRTGAPLAMLSLRLSQAAVARQLTALLGEPVHAPPEFAPTMDLTEGYGGTFAQYLLLAVADFKRADPIPWKPITISGFEDFMISKLLLSHPHNYTAALRRAEKPIAPRDVKRALDYMEAQLGSPITIADIAEASGIAGRTLFKHFQDFHRISPMQYLRSARFAKVREALIRAQPEESVTAIAMNWGFSHMGRFSVEYRKRFGESPSESLKRRRGHS